MTLMEAYKALQAAKGTPGEEAAQKTYSQIFDHERVKRPEYAGPAYGRAFVGVDR